jgi:hypothetical protein
MVIQDREITQEKQKEHHLVPDVRCPGCGSEIKLDNRTYAFYDGPIRCHPCQALFRIRTGDFDLVFQTSVPEFLGYPSVPGATGGMLIAPPELLEPGLAVPPPLLATLSAECIPAESLHHMKTVARHYRNGSWPAMAVFCRAAALRQCGIADGPFIGMIAKARERGLVEGFVLSCCETVREAAGESSHSLEGPTSQREAIAVIAAAATVLGRLYAVPGR